MNRAFAAARRDLLPLDRNECLQPYANLLTALGDVSLEDLSRYPDAAPLEQELAAHLGVSCDSVFVTNGVDDALNRACLVLLRRNTEIVLPTPTFEGLERAARWSSAKVVEVPWWGGSYPVTTVAERVTDRTRAIAVVSPNNPTGGTVTVAELDELAARRGSSWLLVDLAYTEFAAYDLTADALRLNQTLVFRSFSKAMGLAGIRVGYVVGPPAMLEKLREAGPRFPVSAPALHIALARLRMGAAGAEWIKEVKTERSTLYQRLLEYGAEPFPSEANFVTSRFRDAKWVHSVLRSLGILVRQYGAGDSQQPLLRITCPGSAPAFARLLLALRAALRPEVVLIHVDDFLRAERQPDGAVSLKTLIEALRGGTATRAATLVLTTAFPTDRAAARLKECHLQHIADGLAHGPVLRAWRGRAGWVVGRSVPAIKAATMAGFATIGVAFAGPNDRTEERERLLSAEPATVIDHAAEIASLV